jgi:hypothetical protein
MKALDSMKLRQASSSSSSSLQSESTCLIPGIQIVLSEDEQKMVEDTYAKCCKDDGTEYDMDTMMETLLLALPTWPPKLVVKLRQAAAGSLENRAVRAVSQLLNSAMEKNLEIAKETLLELLNAGEVRKLDSLIGKAARLGKLDVAFFNVLSINIRDASEQEDIETVHQSGEAASASRAQILKHIYTRCQEEVEKMIPPGMALLNKLLRTEQDTIRANLYRHYLTPRVSMTIETPDGKMVELQHQRATAVLVPLQEFVAAIDTAVLQIRTVEKTGGADPASTASMVEACRQVAKEARIAIGESYGIESDDLKMFEEALMPVFRPKSPNSPYIQGQN